MKLLPILGFMIMLMSSVMAIDRMEIMTILDMGEDEGMSSLPANIYSVNGMIIKQGGYITASSNGEANVDFYNFLTGGAVSGRDKNVPENAAIQVSGGQLCSLSADNTHVILTRADSTSICIQNDLSYNVIGRLFDMEAKMIYLTEKPVEKNGITCFTVEPEHLYLVDIMHCSSLKCTCTLFSNKACKDMNGTLMMQRTRSCTPSACKSETELVKWIDKTCPVPESVCKETDGGLDITHFGMAKVGDQVYKDVCLSENQLQEYFCADNEILTSMKYCNKGETCEEGKCTMKITKNQTCGIADGMLRFSGDTWCASDRTKYTCKGNTLSVERSHPDCFAQTCGYMNMTLQFGQQVCMNDGVTIAKCSMPLTSDDKFTYTQCQAGTQCARNTMDIGCRQFIKPDAPKQKRAWSFVDLFRKLFARGA